MEIIKCDKCDKKFQDLQKLKTHTLITDCTGKKKEKNISCEYCEKKIASTQMLNYHLGICIVKKVKEKEKECQLTIDKLELELRNLKLEYGKYAEKDQSVDSLRALYNKLEPLSDHVNTLLKIASKS